MKKMTLAGVCAGLLGCAVNYQPPTTAPIDVSTQARASQADLMLSAKRILALEGYQIASIDEKAGIISTEPKVLKVSPADADCGSTMGLDYLRDQRTVSKVGINVLAGDGLLTVKAIISAEYGAGTIDQQVSMACVSKGAIERALAEKITATMKN